MKHELDGVCYWTYGDKKNLPLLLVHGFTGSHEGFQYIIPELSKHFYIIAPDLAGFGDSDLFLPPWTIDELARNTNEFVAKLKLSKKPYVVSHSMGGLVAASMLSQNPELFAKKTVFISPVASRVRTLDSRKAGAVLGSLNYGVGKRTGKLGEKLVKSHRITRATTNLIMTAQEPDMRARIHQHHIDNLGHISSIDFYHHIHRDINRHGVIDYADSLKPYDIRIIAAEKDNVTPLGTEKKLALQLDAQLRTIPNVGHLSHYERPDELSRLVIGFLE